MAHHANCIEVARSVDRRQCHLRQAGEPIQIAIPPASAMDISAQNPARGGRRRPQILLPAPDLPCGFLRPAVPVLVGAFASGPLAACPWEGNSPPFDLLATGCYLKRGPGSADAGGVEDAVQRACLVITSASVREAGTDSVYWNDTSAASSG